MYMNTCLYINTHFRNAKLSVHRRIQTYRSKDTNPHMQGEQGECGHHLQKYTHVYRWIHVCVRTSIPARRGRKVSSLVCKYIHAHIRTRMYIRTCAERVCVNSQKHIRLCMCMCMYIHTRAERVYVDTYTYTYIYANLHLRGEGGKLRDSFREYTF